MSTATVSGAVTNYIYNAMGQLIEKSGNGGTTLLVNDEAAHLLGEYTSTGALIEETIWMGDTPVATLRPSGSTVPIYFVHTDHLGSVRKVTRLSDNGLMWRWDPDTFAGPAANSNPSGLGTFTYNLGYPGQYLLTESFLSYSFFRHYDPSIGAFNEADPIGLLGGSFSTYAYADGNPVGESDPLGLRSLNATEKCKLKAYIPQVDLDNADLHDGQVPWYLGNDFDGITRGNDIYFRAGYYDENTAAGIALLGHELVHVGQYR